MSNITDFSPVITADSFYTPSMMTYDGSTGYYSELNNTCAGNLATISGRFKTAGITGTSSQQIITQILKATGNITRMSVSVRSSDYSTADQQSKMYMYVASDAGATLCFLFSNSVVDDDVTHTFIATFNGDTGAATFIIDGVAQDDVAVAARVAPTAGTLPTGSDITVLVGGTGVAARYFNGDIGFVGYKDAYLTNWSDFMDSAGNPLPLDESTWTEWGGQPLFWNPYGDMENNLGSAGAMTRNGTITVGDDGTTGSSYTLTGTATSIDITAGKTAWVNGTRLDGTYEPPTPQGGRIFDDASQLYKSFTSASNKTTLFLTVTGVQSGATGRRICQVHGPSGYSILSLEVQGTGDLYPNKVYVYQTNSANAAILAAPSSDIVTDGGRYSIFISSDRDLGLYTFVINGVSLYTATNNSTGTQDLGASSFVRFGSISGAQYLRSCIGSMMVAEQYMTNWEDFMDVKGNPKTLDTSGWTEWGGTQPLVYAPNGDLDTNNLGSLGAFTWSP
jgi:hypothetical protein